ncbi:MAG: hypothetical protein NTX50_30610 [Candidatus Sumerlaeota bacterium]|nr:hypothetical protein [Candidatus Sumerlaeota bacterium]
MGENWSGNYPWKPSQDEGPFLRFSWGGCWRIVGILFAMLFGALVILLIVGSIIGGRNSQQYAEEMRRFNEVVERERPIFEQETKPLLAALKDYKNRFGEYPETLQRLQDKGQISVTSPTVGNQCWRYYGDKNRFEISVLCRNAPCGYECFIYTEDGGFHMDR